MESLNKGTGSQGLVPRTVHRKHFKEQVEWTCPKNLNWFEIAELVAGTKLWSLQPDLVAKMASLHDETCEKSWPKTQVVKYIA